MLKKRNVKSATNAGHYSKSTVQSSNLNSTAGSGWQFTGSDPKKEFFSVNAVCIDCKKTLGTAGRYWCDEGPLCEDCGKKYL